ncbi:MAG TPA: Ig-like domain-containing protein, partial [Longimicrobiaceae bacterium]|nr:Ig-like domain-containing protein [Longimicrobiaceae bacterium]
IANGASAAFSATSAAGPAASLQKVSGDAQEGRAGTLLADSLTVRARDEFGNAVSGVTITWSAPSGSVSPATGVTRADGTTRTAYTLPSAGGPATVQAAATGVAPVTFTEVAKASAVYITILQPAPNTRTGDQVLVSARVDSSNASVASVKARAGGQTVALTPFSGTELRGTLDLRSAPSGPLQLVVVGTTVNGDSGTAEVPIVHDAPPTLNVTAPLMGTVARPSVRIDVDCVDAAGPCQSVMASLTSLPFSGTVVASGTTGIHADVSLAAYDGHDWILELRGTDSSGQVVYRELDLVVESSSHLTEVFSGGENLVDFDATRALTQKQAFSHNTGGEYVPWEIRLLDRSTGVETPLASGANLRGKFGTNRNLYPGRLHTNGAIFLAAPCWCDWRAGSLDTLDYTVVFEGDLAAYGNTVRNLATGAESTVPGLFATDVAVNGDVVGLGNYDVVRYRGGTLTPLTSDGASGGPTYVSPLTDGINVAAVRKGGGPTSLRVITTSGSADFGLSASSIPEGLWPHRAYEVENGWTAWLQEDAGAIAQVWVRSPAGVVKQVTSVGQSAAIAALGPNGEVLYTAGGVAYLAQYPYTAAAVRVFSAAYPFEARWSGGDLLMFTGRTAFRVTY